MSKRKPKTLAERADKGSINRSHEECWLAGYRLGQRSRPSVSADDVIDEFDRRHKDKGHDALSRNQCVAAIRAAYAKGRAK